ncbi:adenine deaminase [Holdemanella biformis]|uniref:adenine deaminase n=1 Tax=Holdemanella biformis TaxID=1735 RepID=UPI001899DFC3|nr:adenine deaminase C-terminal domain-containing protein [Holdemanella biformis]
MINLKCDCIEELINASQGYIENDTVFENIKILNVFTKEWIYAHVYIYKKWISHVEYNVDKPLMNSKNIVNGSGLFLCPAFVDAHTHIESSLLTPANYAKLVIPHGTLTILEDAHEIANVAGEKGLEYILSSAKDLPMRQLLTVPSCVPSVPNYENSGANFDYKIYEKFLDEKNVIGLGEVMDYEGVINNDERIGKILETARRKNCYIQGHAPLVTGNRLSAYLCANIKSDHEARQVEEVIEKYRQGMWIDIRDANTNHNMPKIMQALKKIGNYERVSFSSDDRRSDVIQKKGHLDGIIRHAYLCGMPLTEAYISASYRPCLEANINNLGAIAPGYVADLNVLADIESVNIKSVYFEGQCVSKNGKLISMLSVDSSGNDLRNTIHVPSFDEEKFKISSQNKKEIINVIEFESYSSSITNLKQIEFSIQNKQVDISSQKDCMYVAVINRYKKDTYTIGVVKNFGINHGAIASTVGHDSHNIAIVYDNSKNALFALQQLIKQKGGFCAIEDGNVIATLELPIAGLMSDEPINIVVDKITKMNEANAQLGNTYIDNPISRITILSLLVCPYVKISDKGIVLTEEKKYISLFD